MTRILEVGVKAFFRNREGNYLAILRAKPFYGENFCRWDIPGGRIDIGEELLIALKREIHEEIGLKITSRPKILAAQDLLRNPTKHTVRVTYLVESRSTHIILNPAEHTEFKWVSLEEFKKLKHDLYINPIFKLLPKT